MKLKMAKPFNTQLVKQMLLEEDKFISNIFSKMPVPTTELVAQNGYEDYEKEYSNRKKEKALPDSGEIIKRAHTFEELHAKFNELKGKKSHYREKLVKKGLKNRIQKKAKKEEKLMQKKLARTERMAAQANGTQKVKEEIDAPKAPKQKPIFNSKGNMVFSKFDFSEIGTKRKTLKTEKDPKKLLQQLEEKKKKVKELEAAGEQEKAQEIKSKDAWKSALAKAVGEKVKDDPTLLKKTIKREEQKKKHSHKKWESRQAGVQKAIQEKQQKRSENLMKRKKDVKTNKLKKAAKKGRIIAGY